MASLFDSSQLKKQKRFSHIATAQAAQSLENRIKKISINSMVDDSELKPSWESDNPRPRLTIGSMVEVKLSDDIANCLNNKREIIRLEYGKGPLGLAVVRGERSKLRVTKAIGQSADQGLQVGDIIETLNEEQYLGGAANFKKLLISTSRPFSIVASRAKAVLLDNSISQWHRGQISASYKDGTYSVAICTTSDHVDILDPKNCIRSIVSSQQNEPNGQEIDEKVFDEKHLSKDLMIETLTNQEENKRLINVHSKEAIKQKNLQIESVDKLLKVENDPNQEGGDALNQMVNDKLFIDISLSPTKLLGQAAVDHSYVEVIRKNNVVKEEGSWKGGIDRDTLKHAIARKLQCDAPDHDEHKQSEEDPNRTDWTNVSDLTMLDISPSFEVGQKVIAAYAGGVEGWFSGIIDQSFSDGTFGVQYDMGEWEGHVPRECIKSISSDLPITTSPVRQNGNHNGIGKNMNEFFEFFEENADSMSQTEGQADTSLILNNVEHSKTTLDDNEARDWLITAGFSVSLDLSDLTKCWNHTFFNDGKVSMLVWLYEQGFQDLDSKNEDGFAPIHWASRNGHLECCQYLEWKGCNASLKGHKGWTPYHLAAENGFVDIISWLNKLEKTSNDIFEVDRYGWTPLHCAAHGGHLACLALLHGILDTKQKEYEQNQVRRIFSESSKKEKIILVTRYLDVSDKSTTLHIAAAAGHSLVCRWLIKDDFMRKQEIVSKQAQYNDQDDDEEEEDKSFNKDLISLMNEHRQTAVLLAAEKGHLDTLKALVSQNRNMKRNPAHQIDDDDDDNDEGKYELRRRNQFGLPPFFYACSCGQLEVCKWLLVNGGLSEDERQVVHRHRVPSKTNALNENSTSNSDIDSELIYSDIDSELILRMALTGRSSTLGGGSRFIHKETKQKLIQWSRNVLSLQYLFIKTFLFGILYYVEDENGNQRNGNDQTLMSDKYSYEKIKVCGLSGFKEDNDEDARRKIILGKPFNQLKITRPKNNEELRLRRLEAFEGKNLKETKSQNELTISRNKIIRGGGCARNGLPMLQGYEDSVTRLIADFVGIFKGKQLRLIREFSDITKSSW